ncbi:muramidase family protein [Psychroserpens luteus]|uniref:LysM peptidoglycan-binding domain-containing protein n=1 Tax=Psychroserpens luteus TaxID=1434066 RepID=A0ABW5ZXW0_9FLAO|nr:LysM peptidoglycan-binding domain-containing protein [Psychroserpens luteus]
MTRVFFMSLTFFSFCFFYGNAQTLTKNHTVKKGETVYQLSKIYGVSVNAILELNPNAAKVIYIDEILKIPISEETSNAQENEEQSPVKTGSSFVYKVKRGDTKFGLSKKFGITISSLENQNPHIKLVLQAGHVLNINNSNYLSQSQPEYTSTPENTKTNKSHVVVKGDTFYSISKLYSVDLASLISANSSIIPEKMSIGIQVKLPNQGFSNTPLENKTEYFVKKGDTKFGLAKTFNTTIANLESLNPQIVDMLRYGITIKIPSTENSTVVQNNTVEQQPNLEEEEEEVKTETTKENSNTVAIQTPTDSIQDNVETKIDEIKTNVLIDPELTENNNPVDSIPTTTSSITNNQNSNIAYKNYVIEPKETLYGLSKKAGMTIPEFLELNPKLSESVIVGTIIKMPITSFDPNTKLINSSNTSEPKTNSSYTNLSTSITNVKDKKVLMLLSFNDLEFTYYTKNTSNYEAISNPDLRNDIQFYKGALTAIDSLSKLGIETEISLIKIDNNLINKTFQDIDLESFDAIITSNFNKDIETAMMLKTSKSIPVIATKSEYLTYNMNSIYQAIPSVNAQKLKTLQYLNDKKGNIIVISDSDNIESRSFITKNSPNAKIIITNENGEFSNESIISSLDKNTTNYIIIDSNKNGVFLSSTTFLLGQVSNYDIQLVVLESSLLPNNQQISSKRFSILKLIYPDINQITNTAQTLQYFDDYKLKYNIDPTNKALQGFDITFDTMLRLSQDMSFEESVKTVKTEYFLLKFYYIKNDNGVYDNHEIIIREFNNLDIAN